MEIWQENLKILILLGDAISQFQPMHVEIVGLEYFLHLARRVFRTYVNVLTTGEVYLKGRKFRESKFREF